MKIHPLMIVAMAMVMASVSNAQNDPVASQEDTAKTSTTRMSPELLWKLGRLGEAKTSSDGGRIVYSVRRYELAEDKGTSSLHLINAKSNGNSKIIQDWASISSVQWAKTSDGERVFFIGMRGDDDEAETDKGDASEEEGDQVEEAPQAWSLNPDNGDTVQLTNFEGGIANLKVSPAGDHIAFTMDVKLDQEVKDIYPDLPKADARIIDGLMYRHWNAWHDYKYSHLHVAPLKDGKVGEPIDLMKGAKADCPVPPFGGSEQFTWSPDSKEIAFTLKDVPDWAQSTNSDVFVIEIGKEGAKPRNITEGMEGYDNNPVYSPDGKYLAFHSMERPSFESDRNRIMLLDRQSGKMRDLTTGLDQTAHEATWTPDSKNVLFSSEFRGTNQLFRASLESTGVEQVSKGRHNWSLLEIFPDGETALVTKMDMLRPKELAVINLTDATDRVISHVNDEIYATLELPKIEERWVDATDGKKFIVGSFIRLDSTRRAKRNGQC